MFMVMGPQHWLWYIAGMPPELAMADDVPEYDAPFTPYRETYACPAVSLKPLAAHVMYTAVAVLGPGSGCAPGARKMGEPRPARTYATRMVLVVGVLEVG